MPDSVPSAAGRQPWLQSLRVTSIPYLPLFCELLAYHHSPQRRASPGHPLPARSRGPGREPYANEEAIAVYSQAISLIAELGGGSFADIYGAVSESLGIVLARLSWYDAAVQAYQKALATVSDPFQQAHLHVLCSEAETGAHHYLEALGAVRSGRAGPRACVRYSAGDLGYL